MKRADDESIAALPAAVSDRPAAAELRHVATPPVPGRWYAVHGAGLMKCLNANEFETPRGARYFAAVSAVYPATKRMLDAAERIAKELGQPTQWIDDARQTLEETTP